MTTTRPMTDSPLAFAAKVLEVARAALPAHAPKFSKRTFTRHQHAAILAVELFLRTNYRGVAAYLRDGPDLRAALGLAKVPHFTTLQKAHARLKKGRRRPPDGHRGPGLNRHVQIGKASSAVSAGHPGTHRHDVGAGGRRTQGRGRPRDQQCQDKPDGKAGDPPRGTGRSDGRHGCKFDGHTRQANQREFLPAFLCCRPHRRNRMRPGRR